MKRAPVWFVLAAFLGLWFMAFAADAASAQDNYPPPIVPEAAKLPLIQALLDSPDGMMLSLKQPSGEGTGEKRAWCEKFIADFEAGEGVAFVEPVVRSDRYDDPAFAPWQRRCPNLALNASVNPFHVFMYGDVPKMPWHMPDGQPLVGYQFGTRNFKLYLTDLDNDPKTGEEIVFYSEHAYNYWEAVIADDRFPLALPPLDRNWNDILPPEEAPAQSFYGGGNYKWLNSRVCLADDLLLTRPIYDIAAGTPVEGHNGIIDYGGRRYLFTLQRTAAENGLELELVELLWTDAGEAGTGSVCEFRAGD